MAENTEAVLNIMEQHHKNGDTLGLKLELYRLEPPLSEDQSKRAQILGRDPEIWKSIFLDAARADQMKDLDPIGFKRELSQSLAGARILGMLDPEKAPALYQHFAGYAERSGLSLTETPPEPPTNPEAGAEDVAEAEDENDEMDPEKRAELEQLFTRLAGGWETEDRIRIEQDIGGVLELPEEERTWDLVGLHQRIESDPYGQSRRLLTGYNKAGILSLKETQRAEIFKDASPTLKEKLIKLVGEESTSHRVVNFRGEYSEPFKEAFNSFIAQIVLDLGIDQEPLRKAAGDYAAAQGTFVNMLLQPTHYIEQLTSAFAERNHALRELNQLQAAQEARVHAYLVNLLKEAGFETYDGPVDGEKLVKKNSGGGNADTTVTTEPPHLELPDPRVV